MPIHDWTRVPDGIFHHFHQKWTGMIADALNAGLLPEGCYALVEQRTGVFGPDVLTLQTLDRPPSVPDPALPGQLIDDSVIVRHARDDRTVACVEVVSPGNKATRDLFRAFIEKATEALDRGVHLLIIDVFPPSERDPQGIHVAVWSEIANDSYVAPPDKPLTLAAYEATSPKCAYVEPVAVGDALIDMPLFLLPAHYVAVPLEATYRSAYQSVPLRWRRVLEGQAQAG